MTDKLSIDGTLVQVTIKYKAIYYNPDLSWDISQQMKPKYESHVKFFTPA